MGTPGVTDVRLTLTGFDHGWSEDLIHLTHDPSPGGLSDASVFPIILCRNDWSLIGTYAFRDDANQRLPALRLRRPRQLHRGGRLHPVTDDDAPNNRFADQFAAGRQADGVWTLRIEDWFERGKNDVGTLDSWTIDLYVTDPEAGDDSDGDGTADCLDGCPNDGDKTEPGGCGCGTPDTDSDGDGDCTDGCPNDGDKIEPGDCGSHPRHRL